MDAKWCNDGDDDAKGRGSIRTSSRTHIAALPHPITHYLCIGIALFTRAEVNEGEQACLGEREGPMGGKSVEGIPRGAMLTPASTTSVCTRVASGSEPAAFLRRTHVL